MYYQKTKLSATTILGGRMYREYLTYILEPLEGHDKENLIKVAKKLQESDGEGWAVGEMLYHALQIIQTQENIMNKEV
jgi:hypothetical protein